MLTRTTLSQVLAAVLAVAPARGAAAPIEVGKPVRAVLVLSTPEGPRRGVHEAELFRDASEAFARETRLALVSLEQVGCGAQCFERCDTPACWRAKLPVAWVLQVSIAPGKGEARLLTLTAMDLRAGTIAARHAGEVELWDGSSRAAWIEAALARMRPTLEARGVWGAPARIAVDVADRARLALDGVTLAEVDPGRTELVGVAPGPHQIGIADPLDASREASAELAAAPGATASIALRLPPARTDTPAAITFWAGAGAAVAGAAILGASLAAGGERAYRVCLATPCDPGGATWRAFGDEPHLGLSATPPGGGAIPMAPLGLALLTLGATWSIGALLEDGTPWWSLALGAGAGALLFGAGMATK